MELGLKSPQTAHLADNIAVGAKCENMYGRLPEMKVAMTA